MTIVSVILPAYNAERWIGEAIESVLAQSWTTLEVIVVDDGSTDGTVALAEGITDSRVKVIRQENRGAAAARNTGLAHATGDYVQFLDADDLLSPCKLESQMKALEPFGADAVASCAWGKFSDDCSNARIAPEPVWEIQDPGDWLVCSLCGGGMMHSGGWLAPRKLIDRAGPWDETLTLHDDGEFFTRVLLLAGRNLFVPGPVVYYREVPGSLSRTTGRKAMESALSVCRSRHRHLLAAADTMETRRAVSTQYAQFAYQFARLAPDLASTALESIRQLNAEPVPCIGGTAFRMLMQTMGFQHAWKVRNSFRFGLSR